MLTLIALSALFYLCVIKPFTYWTRKGVAQKSVIEQWMDVVYALFRLKSQSEINVMHYNQFTNKRFCGAYHLLSPVLYLRDPALIKQITVHDFDHFVDHKQYMPDGFEPLWEKNLFSLKGDNWRTMRSTLSPSFTSSKMKAMFMLINGCAQQFVSHFKDETRIVEMKDVFRGFVNDVIASTAFGITCNSLEDPNNEFYQMGKEATNTGGLWYTLRAIITMIFPKLTMALGIKVFSSKVRHFFMNLVRTNMETRERNGIVRPDMIHLLMEARKGRLKHEDDNVLDRGFAVIQESAVGREENRSKPQLTDEDLTAQALLFFFAGFNSASSLMSFLVHELAANPEIQETLRGEVDQTLKDGGGSLTYESLLKMKYMDMVVSETLRKWPTVIGIDRVCVKPYTIQPVEDGEKPIHINVGEILWLPIFATHRNQQFYPDPERFDPERFSDANKHKINPYAYIPFGMGPRSCIGNRFALLEAKTVLFHILSMFVIEVTDRTDVPIKLAKGLFGLDAQNGFWVQLKPRCRQ